MGFKVGYIIHDIHGNKATITHIDDQCIIVLHKGIKKVIPSGWARDNMRLLKVPNTVIARKLHPNYVKEGKWLVPSIK